MYLIDSADTFDMADDSFRVQMKISFLSPGRKQSTSEWEQQTPNKHSSVCIKLFFYLVSS